MHATLNFLSNEALNVFICIVGIYIEQDIILSQYVFIKGYNVSWFEQHCLNKLCRHSDEMLTDKTTNVMFKINLK